MKTLRVYLPCYNEAGNIRQLILEWLAEESALGEAGFALRVTGVDDKSTDDTLSILNELADRYETVAVIPHPVNQNLGAD